jgi:amidohydrolase family protein
MPIVDAQVHIWSGGKPRNPSHRQMDWLWPTAERAGIPIALQSSHFMSTVGQVAERHPRLKLIVDHLGRVSGTKDDAAWANLGEMHVLGHGHHAHAVLLAAVRDPLHGGAAVAHRARPGSRHGTRDLQLARLEAGVIDRAESAR